MAYIQERKTADGRVTYRAQVRLKGFEIQTATFERKTDAKRWASSKESALKEGRYFPSSESKKRTVKDLCERYINQVLPDAKPKYRYNQTQQLNRWIAEIGHLSLCDVTPSVIAEVRDRLLEEITYRGTKRGPASSPLYGIAVSSFFKSYYGMGVV